MVLKSGSWSYGRFSTATITWSKFGCFVVWASTRPSAYLLLISDLLATLHSSTPLLYSLWSPPSCTLPSLSPCWPCCPSWTSPSFSTADKVQMTWPFEVLLLSQKGRQQLPCKGLSCAVCTHPHTHTLCHLQEEDNEHHLGVDVEGPCKPLTPISSHS